MSRHTSSAAPSNRDRLTLDQRYLPRSCGACKCFDPAIKDVRLPQYSTLQGYEQNIEWSTHRWWAIGAAASEQNGGPSPAGCCNA